MTKDDIIRIAIEAGFSQEDDDIFICGIEHIQKILEIEREACARLCEKADRYRGDYFAAVIRARGQE
jgi:PP-loop superfamily ATP-utilizing enzyme